MGVLSDLLETPSKFIQVYYGYYYISPLIEARQNAQVVIPKLTDRKKEILPYLENKEDKYSNIHSEIFKVPYKDGTYFFNYEFCKNVIFFNKSNLDEKDLSKVYLSKIIYLENMDYNKIDIFSNPLYNCVVRLISFSEVIIEDMDEFIYKARDSEFRDYIYKSSTIPSSYGNLLLQMKSLKLSIISGLRKVYTEVR